jgi:hypothetical protein
MKKMIPIVIALWMLVHSGCSVSFNILSGNSVLSTRSPAAVGGEQLLEVEGGGSPTVSPNVSVVPK